MSALHLLEQIVSLGHETAEVPADEIESAASFALRRMEHCIGAFNAYWIAAVRDSNVKPQDPAHGWRPHDILYAHDQAQMVRTNSTVAERMAGGEVDPATAAIIAHAGKTRCFLREELVSDQEWEKSWIVNEVHRPRGIADQLVAGQPLGPRHESYIGLVRGPEERRFTGRDRDLLLLFMHATRPLQQRLMIYRGLAGAARLTIRERDVMRLLVTDRTEKEIAARLGISEFTVHQHARSVYAKHNVSGRLGLMAAAIERKFETETNA